MMRVRVLLIMTGVAALSGCDKLPPDEIVYTGPMDAGVSGMDATSPRPRSDAGDAGEVSTVVPQCGPRPAAAVAFSKAALLESVGQCAQLRYCEFEAYQRDLTEKVAAYARTPTAAALAEARAAWRFANLSWQRAELFRFGPAASSMDPGGRDLRDDIQAFPLFDRCRVDEQTVSQRYAAQDFGTTLKTGRTLPTLEYLLFYEGLDNGCSQFSAINADGAWRALSADVLSARRRAYAEAVARDVDARAKALVDAWDPAKGNFQRSFATAGAGSTVYARQQDALNAFGAALFYLDRELKDWKLALPLGVTLDCTQDCAGRVESRYAGISTRNIQENLAGFRELFEGCGLGGAGLGIDDWLRSVGGGALADRMLALLGEAEAAARVLSPALEDEIRDDRAAVDALRQKVKAITDLLKTELSSLLDLELPMNLEGDND